MKKCKTTNKICYRDKISAMIALSQIKSNRGARLERRFYMCRFCKNYHLTKQKNKNEM